MTTRRTFLKGAAGAAAASALPVEVAGEAVAKSIPVAPSAGLSFWQPSMAYPAGQIVEHSGKLFTCLEAIGEVSDEHAPALRARIRS